MRVSLRLFCLLVLAFELLGGQKEWKQKANGGKGAPEMLFQSPGEVTQQQLFLPPIATIMAIENNTPPPPPLTLGQ